MYFPDLSSRFHPEAPYQVYDVGWLEKGFDYSQGEVSPDLKEKLKAVLFTPAYCHRTRGFHTCDFCGGSFMKVEHEGQTCTLGSAEIWLPAEDKIIYAAPTMIYHYIMEHNYCPPTPYLTALAAFDLHSGWDGEAIITELKTRKR